MTEEQATLAHVRAVIDELPLEQRQAVQLVAGQLRQLCSDNPQINYLALALVGAEIVAS